MSRKRDKELTFWWIVKLTSEDWHSVSNMLYKMPVDLQNELMVKNIRGKIGRECKNLVNDNVLIKRIQNKEDGTFRYLYKCIQQLEVPDWFKWEEREARKKITCKECAFYDSCVLRLSMKKLLEVGELNGKIKEEYEEMCSAIRIHGDDIRV